jgi:curli production assembly/transport component CsgG
MCVMEAIEKAVLGLIIEGILEKKWALQDENGLQAAVIREYVAEKENVPQWTDRCAAVVHQRKVSVWASVGSQWVGCGKNLDFEPAAAAQIWYRINPYCSAVLGLGAGGIGNRAQYYGRVLTIDLRGLFEFFPEWRITPCFTAGVGVMNSWMKDPGGTPLARDMTYLAGFVPALVLGGGVRYSIGELNSLLLEVQNHRAFTDDFDAVSDGDRSDDFWTVLMGMSVSLPKIRKSN